MGRGGGGEKEKEWQELIFQNMSYITTRIVLRLFL